MSAQPVKPVSQGSADPVEQMRPAVPASGEPLRVLHVNSGNLYGGVETVLVTLARLQHLCGTMESAFALCYAGRLSGELTEIGVPVYQLGGVRLSRPWTVWRARRRLRALLSRERFDLVICHMTWTLAVFGKAARAQHKKLALWSHGFQTGGWVDRLARRTAPDIAICNSRFTKTGINDVYPGVQASVVHLPVALSDSPDTSQWRARVRREEGASPDRAVIIQVGRLEAGKGHMQLLQALSLMQDLDGWTCWIVGGPQKPDEEQYLRDLQNSAAELGVANRVRFLGQRSDIPQLLAAADIFCQPNERPEGFGIVFIEALWAGCPVVTTAIGGAVEIIDESCGFLVEPGDPAGLAERLRQLVGSPALRARVRQAGRARASQLCDPARQMNVLSDLCRRVVEQRMEP